MTAKVATRCFLQALPQELLIEVAPRLLDCAQPVGCLASTCRSLARALVRVSDQDSTQSSRSLLRVGSMRVSSLPVLSKGLARASISDLQILRVDFSSSSAERRSRKEVEQGLQELGRRLPDACVLRELSVRLASFDVAMERLRLGPETWEALIGGLSGIAQHARLQRLELSNITIKASRATQAVEVPARRSRVLRRAASSPTRRSMSALCEDEKMLRGEEDEQPTARSFLETLGQLTGLEELRLTQDELFPCTARLLPEALRALRRLRLLDLTRNHISKDVINELKEALPKELKLVGEQQTFFFY